MSKTLKANLVLALCLGLSGGAVVSAQNSHHQQKTVTSSSTGLSVSTVNGQSVVTLNGKEIYSGPTKGQVSSRSSSVNGVEYSAVFDGDTVLWENVPGAAKQVQAAPNAPGGFDHKQFMDQHQQTVERMKAEQRKFMETHGGTNLVHGNSGGFTRSGGGGSSGGSSGGSGSSGGGSSGGHSESRSTSQSGNVSISTKTVNGSTVITYQGKEISVGPTQGHVSTKTKTVNGTAYAIALEGDRVIWENVPGAAQMVK